MSQILSSIRKFLVTLAIILVVAGVIGSYFFFVFPKKEEELHSRGFRILSRLEKNITEKKMNYVYQVGELNSKQPKDPAFLGDLNIMDSIYEEDWKAKYAAKNFHIFFDPTNESWKIYFFGNYYIRNKKELANINATVPQENQIQIVKNENPSRVQLKVENKEPKISFSSDFKINLPDQGKSKKAKSIDSIYFPDNSFLYKINKKIVYALEVSNFLEPVINYRRDFFEDYIVISDTSVIYQTHSLAAANNSLKDSLLNKSSFITGKVVEAKLEGKNYKIFFHPFNQSSGLKFTLCGIIPVENYNKQKYYLNNYHAVVAVCVFLLALFALPFIKIFTITKYEPLLKSDILLIFAASFGIFLIISVLFYTQFLNWDNYWKDEKLETMSKTIHDRFKQEVSNCIAAIDKVEYDLSYDSTKTFGLWFQENSGRAWSNVNDAKDAYFQNLFINHRLFVKNVLFLDSTGFMNARWSPEKKYNIPNISVKHRAYFQSIHQQNNPGWNIKKEVEGKYAIEAIYSYQDQQNTVVFSKKLDNLLVHSRDEPKRSNNILANNGIEVLALETKLFTVMQPVLPDEYGFCIIDEKGEVLFHSDFKRNLRENFLDECNHHENLSAAMKTRTTSSFNVQLYGNEYEAIARPVSSMPLFLITFKDKTFQRNSVADVVTFSILNGAFILILFALMLLVQYALSSHTTYLKKQKWDLGFLQFSDVHLNVALQITFFLLLNTALFIVFAIYLKGIDRIFVCILLSISIPGMVVLLLLAGIKNEVDLLPYKVTIYKKYHNQSIIVFIAMLIVLIAYVDNIYDLHLPFSWVYIIFFTLYAFFILVFGLNATCLNKLINFLKKLDRSIINLFSSSKPALSETEYSLIQRQKQIWIYPMILLLLIVNIIVIPTAMLFYSATKTEAIFAYKRNNLVRAEQLVERENTIINSSAEISYFVKSNQENLALEGCYWTFQDNLFYTNTIPKSRRKTKSRFDLFYLNTMNKIRLKYHKDEFMRLGFDTPENTDGTWEWGWGIEKSLEKMTKEEKEKVEKNFYFLYGYPFQKSLIHDKKFIAIFPKISPFPEIIKGDGKKQMAFILLFLFFIGIFYALLRYIYKKITLSDYFYGSAIQLNKFYNEEDAFRTCANLLIIALPGSGIERKFKKSVLLKKGFTLFPRVIKGLNPDRYEFYKLDPNFKLSYEFLVILKYFDLKEDKSQELSQVLDSLLKLFKTNDTKIIWLSHKDPSLEVCARRKASLADFQENFQKNNLQAREELQTQSSNYHKMLHLLDDFHQIYFPFHKSKKLIPTGRKNKLVYINQLLNDELNHGNYLFSLRKLVFTNTIFLNSNLTEEQLFQQNFNLHEEIILKIQDIAYSYYLSIWNCLSKYEMFVLYDLAGDNLTNYHNLSTLLVLKSKGLITYDDKGKNIQIFNKSFRNFILTEVDPGEAMILEQKVKTSSLWDNIRMGTILVLVLIGGFLFITQESTFQKIAGLITALSSVIPLLLRSFGSALNKQQGG